MHFLKKITFYKHPDAGLQNIKILIHWRMLLFDFLAKHLARKIGLKINYKVTALVFITSV